MLNNKFVKLGLLFFKVIITYLIFPACIGILWGIGYGHSAAVIVRICVIFIALRLTIEWFALIMAEVFGIGR